MLLMFLLQAMGIENEIEMTKRGTRTIPDLFGWPLPYGDVTGSAN